MTVCTRNRRCLFGDIVGEEIHVNDIGRLVQIVWDGLADHYPHVALDARVIMPNHVHGIIWLVTPNRDTPIPVGAGQQSAHDHDPHFVGAGFKPAPTQDMTRHGLPEIVRAFKTFSARRINALRGTPGTSVWKRNYYEHVIRNDDDLQRIRQYIADNPKCWAEDTENPACGVIRETPRWGDAP